MKLIENAGRWYRMFSVQALIAISGLQGVLAVLSPDQAMKPVPLLGATTWAGLGAILTIVVAVLGAIGRMVDQGSVTEVQK